MIATGLERDRFRSIYFLESPKLSGRTDYTDVRYV